MKRKIITIDEKKCNGCGLCVTACHEGALAIVDGKAKLVSDSYCDGLGACLPECPMDAIHLEEREAAEFDEAAVKARMSQLDAEKAPTTDDACGCGGGHGAHGGHGHGGHGHAAHGGTPAGGHGHAAHGGAPAGGHGFGGGCPGSRAMALKKNAASEAVQAAPAAPTAPVASAPAAPQQSELGQWPCQIKLVPVNAPYFAGADLLIAADCTAFAYANIHRDYMKGKITLIGCPKLDEGDYADKLTAILANNDIRSVTVLRMSVPCCGGIVNAVKKALVQSGNMVPWSVTVISPDGEIVQ